MDKGCVPEHLGKREEELSITNLSRIFMVSNLEVQGAFEEFSEELRQLFDISWSAVTVAFDDNLCFLALSSKIGSAWQTGERIPIKGTGTESVVAHKKAVVESDISQESRFITRESYLDQGVRSIAYLPLMTKDEAIGSLIVASCKPNAYSQRDTTLINQLACEIAMPIKDSRLYAEVREKTRVDELTGLPDRHSLDETISAEITQHSRYGGVFSLIILDIDSFKAINDKYGHQVGDEILRDVGITAKSMTRNADQVFRCGSDEFAILLPNTAIDGANRVAERIQQLVASTAEARNIPVTISIGVANWPNNGLVANEIIGATDTALHTAKRAGGNQSRCFSGVQPSIEHTGASSLDRQDDEESNAVYALAAVVDARHYYNRSHWRKVKEGVTALAKALSMEPADIERLQTCALLHDVGKIVINDKVINKCGRLTAKEWEIVKSHPQVGANIVGHDAQLTPCLPGILHHHERYDGSGYPDGLKGEDIPLDARIMAIADSFAAMTSDRSYSDAFTPQMALEEIEQCSGTQFDPSLVEIFALCVKEGLLLPQQRQRAQI